MCSKQTRGVRQPAGVVITCPDWVVVSPDIGRLPAAVGRRSLFCRARPVCWGRRAHSCGLRGTGAVRRSSRSSGGQRASRLWLWAAAFVCGRCRCRRELPRNGSITLSSITSPLQQTRRRSVHRPARQFPAQVVLLPPLIAGPRVADGGRRRHGGVSSAGADDRRTRRDVPSRASTGRLVSPSHRTEPETGTFRTV